MEKSHWQNIYRECVVASPNWMMRTAELRETGGFSAIEYPEDYDLVFRWYKHNFNIKTVPETTLHWREHPQRTSRSSGHYSQKAFFRMKLQRFLQLDYDPQKTLCLWGTGRKGKLAARLLLQSRIPFTWMGHLPDTRPLYEQPVSDYRKLADLNRPQLLIAVYPPPQQRAEMESYLQELQLLPGRGCWFL